MPYYKDVNGKPYFLEDQKFLHFIPLGCVEITEEEAQAILAPTLPQAKEIKLHELQRARDAAETADVMVQGKQFSASKDIADRFEKLSTRLRRGKPTALAAIFTVDGTPVNPVTAALLEQIEDAIAAQVEDAWNKYGTLVGQVMAATNNTQVEAIAW